MLAARLKNEKTALLLLLLLGSVLMLAFLGTRELWTQEGRWGTIVWNMLIQKDFFHPYCYGAPYYDKPLLSYWLPLLMTFLSGFFNEWTLRLPSALLSIAALYAFYRLGSQLNDRKTGLIAAALLLSTFYFIFWARVASADASNVAGIIIALAWFFEHEHTSEFLPYLVFFVILALSALCKGLLAPVVVLIALLPALLPEKRFLVHLNYRFFLALLVGVLIYFVPFILSYHTPASSAQQSGLWLVFRENFLRYFAPYDHIEPFYVYFYYLPLYIFPWIMILIPTLYQSIKQYQTLSHEARWALLAFLAVFCFLDLSGSRRNYYTLTLVPFALLLCALYLRTASAKIQRFAKWLFGVALAVNFLFFVVFQPLFSSDKPLEQLAHHLQQDAARVAPWEKWQVVMVDASIKMPFYLQSPRPAIFINPEKLQARITKLKTHYSYLVFITRQDSLPYFNTLKPLNVIKQAETRADKLLGRHDRSLSIGLLWHA